MTDDSLRAFGDPDKWEPDKARAVFEKAPFESPASAFAARHPEVMSKSNIQYIGQTHRLRLLLGGPQCGPPPESVVTDGSLRTFGDPDKWEPEKARAVFLKAPFESPASAFAARHPGVLSHRYIQQIGQVHKLRKLLGGGVPGTPPPEIITDNTLRAFGDPARWDPEKARAVFLKAQDIARERIAKMHRTRLPVGVADCADPTGPGGLGARRRDRRGAGPGLGEGRDRAPGGRRDSEGINGAVGGPRSRRR